MVNSISNKKIWNKRTHSANIILVYTSKALTLQLLSSTIIQVWNAIDREQCLKKTDQTFPTSYIRLRTIHYRYIHSVKTRPHKSFQNKRTDISRVVIGEGVEITTFWPYLDRYLVVMITSLPESLLVMITPFGYRYCDHYYIFTLWCYQPIK